MRQLIINLFSAGLVLALFTTCEKFPQDEQLVYTNDFEQSVLTDITGGTIDTRNGSKMLGRYFDGGFQLNLDNLPKHDVIKISFDLYINDSWDGNSVGSRDAVGGPDLWQMKVDGATYINTTFSNSPCNDTYCLMQSYPHNYPYNNPPKTGAYRADLPGTCHLLGIPGGTSLYKIEKIISHKSSSVLLEFRDSLKQSNSGDPFCDESWSLDNLSITTSTLK